jgi:ribosome-binding factor A
MNRLHDPRIPTITSVTRVEVAPDFSQARVFVSVMGTEAQRNLALTALRSSAGHIRRLLGPQLALRKIPAVEFVLDDSLRRSFETVAAIDEAMRELGEAPAWERAEDADEDAARPASPPGEDAPRPHEAAEEDR